MQTDWGDIQSGLQVLIALTSRFRREPAIDFVRKQGPCLGPTP